MRAEGLLSDLLTLSKGVPQGSILGPALLKIYVNIVALAVGDCHLNLYPDDTVL